MSKRARVAVLLAALLPATAAAAPPSHEHQLQRKLDRFVATGVPGAVALERRGGRMIRRASGVGRLDPRGPDPTDRFRVGSVTKPFVATVALQLFPEGKLALRDSVER